jgi:hypothetical protein
MGGNPMCNAEVIPNGDPQHKLDPNNACLWCTCSKHVRRLRFMEAAGLVVRDGRKEPEKSDTFRSRGVCRSLPFLAFALGFIRSLWSPEEDLIKLRFFAPLFDFPTLLCL